MNVNFRRATVWLALLGIVLGYAVFQSGGVDLNDWNVCLLGLALLGLAYTFGYARAKLEPAHGNRLPWPVVVLPLYAALQTVPLPASLLRALSPSRAELLNALSRAVPGVTFAPLSVAPSATMAHFFRICGYAILFLLIREIAGRVAKQPWVLVSPIVVIATLEALLGLLQFASNSPDQAVRGTYVNRNHYAGLLEMAFPFAAVFPIAALQRARRFGNRTVAVVLWSCAGMIAAALIFLGIIYSLSRTGFVSSLCSLFLMLMLAVLPSRLSWRGKCVLGGLVTAAVVIVFAFLPPGQLVIRFAELSGSSHGMDDRTGVWRDTLHLIAAYPVFGCGLGGYESAYPKFSTSGKLVTQDYAHNDYLQLLAESGCIGFCIAAALVLIVLRNAFLAVWKRTAAHDYWIGLASMGAIAAILMHSLVDFNLYIPANALQFAWILGVAGSIRAAVVRPGGDPGQAGPVIESDRSYGPADDGQLVQPGQRTGSRPPHFFSRYG